MVATALREQLFRACEVALEAPVGIVVVLLQCIVEPPWARGQPGEWFILKLAQNCGGWDVVPHNTAVNRVLVGSKGGCLSGACWPMGLWGGVWMCCTMHLRVSKQDA